MVATKAVDKDAGKDDHEKQADSFFYNKKLNGMCFSFIWSFCCAVMVGIVWWIPSFILGVIQDKKYEIFDDIVEADGLLAITLVSAANAIIFAGASAGIVYFGGVIIAGSGLPQLISYMGCGYTMNPDFMGAKTLVLKNFAMIFTVISGVCVGREGPAIQIGAATAYNVGRGIRSFIWWICKKYPFMYECLSEMEAGDFRQRWSGEFDHELIHIGAAAGFACAFNAPLGGMMFVYEEISSHWTQHNQMSSRVFFGVAVAIGLQFLLYQAVAADYGQKFDSIIVFNEETNSIDESWNYSDLPFMLFMAVTCAAINAFNQIYAMKSHRAHRAMFESKEARAGVAICVAVITSVIFTTAPVLVQVCKVLPTEAQLAKIDGTRRYVAYGTCKDGYYNEMASLTLSGGEEDIRHLFSRDSFTFEIGVLAFFIFIYCICFVIQTGTFVPAGNFVPNVIIGAAVGRFWGEIAHLSYIGTTIPYSHPGVYAVVGATCQLTAWTRTMPAIMVTMFEVTSDTSLTIPMLFFATVARSATSLMTDSPDGWAHGLLHSPHVNLPHEKVEPELWTENELLTDEERVKRRDDAHHAHDHAHDEHHDAIPVHGANDQKGRIAVHEVKNSHTAEGEMNPNPIHNADL